MKFNWRQPSGVVEEFDPVARDAALVATAYAEITRLRDEVDAADALVAELRGQVREAVRARVAAEQASTTARLDEQQWRRACVFMEEKVEAQKEEFRVALEAIGVVLPRA